MDNVPIIALVAALILLLVLSAFFSMAETGMMAINRYRLRALERTGHRGAKLASDLLRETDKLLSVLLAGNTLVNAAITMIVSVITIDLFGHDRMVLGIATVVVAFLILVFAEITPKVIGARYPEQVALAASYVLKHLVKSLLWTLWIANLFVRGTSVAAARPGRRQGDTAAVDRGAAHPRTRIGAVHAEEAPEHPPQPVRSRGNHGRRCDDAPSADRGRRYRGP